MAEITGPVEIRNVAQTLAVSCQRDTIPDGSAITHNYNTGDAVKLRRVHASAFGRCQIDILIGPSSGGTLKASLHTTPENPSVAWVLDEPLNVPGTETIFVLRKNEDGEPLTVTTSIHLE